MTQYAAPAPRPPGPRPPATGSPAAGPARARRPVWLSLPAIVIGLAMLGSAGFIAYVVAAVREDQIPLLATGFVVLGATFVAIAIWSLVGVWRAASRALGGRASGLAVLGGLAGLGAIGCFSVAVLMTMVWNT